MKPTWLLAVILVTPLAAVPETCSVSCAIHGLAAKNHRTLAAHQTPTAGSCKIGTKGGFPMPDPTCTPGAYNPTVTVAVLTNANFRTCCIRDKVRARRPRRSPTSGMESPLPPTTRVNRKSANSTTWSRSSWVAPIRWTTFGLSVVPTAQRSWTAI